MFKRSSLLLNECWRLKLDDNLTDFPFNEDMSENVKTSPTRNTFFSDKVCENGSCNIQNSFVSSVAFPHYSTILKGKYNSES